MSQPMSHCMITIPTDLLVLLASRVWAILVRHSMPVYTLYAAFSHLNSTIAMLLHDGAMQCKIMQICRS